MRFSALLWDMDGTLFDTYPAIRKAVLDTFAASGVAVDPVEVARLLAVTFDHCLQVLSARHNLDADALSARYHRRSAQINPAEQPPFPGALSLCRRTIAAGGVNLIFTHRGRESLDRFLAHYAMTDLFADTMTGDEGCPRKPDPAGFLTLAARNRIVAADVLTIGDRDLDIQAGIAAGMKTAYFAPEGFPGGQPPLAATPDYTVTTYAELEAILFDMQGA
jgi:phosphoglycolate phosphatase-like HAD superfamily hydrolase